MPEAEQAGGRLRVRPEIEAVIRENRDFTDGERCSFGLDELAINIRHWLKWTKDSRAKEGLGCDEFTDVQFPVHPSYTQFERWAELLERSAGQIRSFAPPGVTEP